MLAVVVDEKLVSTVIFNDEWRTMFDRLGDQA